MKTYHLNELFKTSWDELSLQEICKMLELGEMLMKIEHGSREHGLVSIEILRTLRKKRSTVAELELEQAVDCFNAITFFQRTPKGSFQTPWYFFPVDAFRASGRTFCPPELIGGLPMYNRTFDQLVYADAAYSKFCVLHYQYSLTPDKSLALEMEETVNQLIAVLYKQPDQFDPVEIERNARVIAPKLNLQKRALILHTYANVRSFILDRCPTLFPKPSEDDEEVSQVPVYTGPMWMTLRYDLAKTEVFKGLETARTAMLYEALDFLEKEALEISNRPTHAKG